MQDSDARTRPGSPAPVADDEAQRAARELACEAAGVGTFDRDLLPGTLSWDERLRELFGYGTDDVDSPIEAFNARLHPEDLPRVSAALQPAIEASGAFDAECRVLLPGGRTRWVGARGRALAGEDGARRWRCRQECPVRSDTADPPARAQPRRRRRHVPALTLLQA